MKACSGYRKLFAMIIMVAMTCNGIRASNTMQMGSASPGPLQPFTLSVRIDNSDPFVTFQFDLLIPSGFLFIDNSAVLNPTRSNGHILHAQIINGNILRILGYSPVNTPFSGDTGTIMTFQLSSGPIPGTFPLTMQSPVIGNIALTNVLTGYSNGTATVLASNINIPATTLNFSRTPLGQSTTRGLQIKNTGNQILEIISITFDSPYFEVIGNTVFSLLPGQATTVSIRFNAVVKGTYDQTMTITSNDPDEGTKTVSLQSRAYPVNEFRTANLSTFSGQQKTLNFSMNNMEGVTGFQFDLELPPPLTYVEGTAMLTSRKVDHAISASMVSGNKLRILAFSPSMQIFSGTSGTVLTLGFMVVGAGGSYPLNISEVVLSDIGGQNCLSNAFNGTLQIAASDIFCSNVLAFEDVSILETGSSLFQITNTGNDTLKISQIIFTNPDFSLSTPLPVYILPSSNKQLQIDFLPSGEGMASCTMKIFSNDPEAFENPMPVNLSAYVFRPNYMSLPAFNVRDIDTITIPLKIVNIDSFVGFQADVGVPSELTYLPNSATLSSRAQDHILSVTRFDSTHFRLIAYSLTGKPFTGDTGTIATLSFVLNTEDTLFTPLPFSLTNAVLGNSEPHDILYETDCGLLNVQYPRILSGNCTYNNTQNTPIESVKVILKANDLKLDSVNTMANGYYSFFGLYPGSYSIEMTFGAPWAGVNGTDALKVMRHVIGLETLPTPVRESAADVNLSHTISAMDVLHIKKRFVGLESSFARGDWVFEKQTGGNSVVIENHNTTVNFYGLCTGDVNGSHIPGNSSKSSTVVMSTSDEEMFASPGQEICLPVSLKNNCTMGALSLVLSYPEESFHIEEVTTVEGTPLFSVSSGVLKVVWAELEPITVLADKPIAYIRIKTDENLLPGAVLRFDNASDLTEISDGAGEPYYGIEISIPAVQITGETGERPMFFAPNPARHEMKVFFWFDEKGATTLKMYDLKGTLVKTIHSIPTNEGLNQTILDVSFLSKGEYIIDLISTGPTLKTQKTGKLFID